MLTFQQATFHKGENTDIYYLSHTGVHMIRGCDARESLNYKKLNFHELFFFNNILYYCELNELYKRV